MELTPRLALAASFCRESRRIIDVGCDHAYLCLALMERGAEYAFASDLRPGPLQAAAEHVAAAGRSGQIETVLCPGLDAFSPEDADTVVICGMGGELIADILAAAPWTKDGAHRLVLQPMTCADRLRRWLAENGYVILQEALAQEGHHLYTVLEVRGGTPGDTGEQNFFLFTDGLTRDPLFPAFARQQIGILSRAAAGKRLAGLDTAADEAVIKRLEECTHGA